ncbi:hypothetical protein, conserved in T. vivax [Trypanosoma vivax Y486]|uniref:Uncharacterized protein n=1 Tax=Trypanosoma vivax (strain Y486) TaxID=1055687 RepID=F9WR58_TRYVY|nr:hypothetical protein, conserved in T. vivax [Trypanosoma vivax Y486]|eukprot:CCD20042.1 hypothetical protein, conserved in T. vivax [Trypanosoma vivax Y486]
MCRAVLSACLGASQHQRRSAALRTASEGARVTAFRVRPLSRLMLCPVACVRGGGIRVLRRRRPGVRCTRRTAGCAAEAFSASAASCMRTPGKRSCALLGRGAPRSHKALRGPGKGGSRCVGHWRAVSSPRPKSMHASEATADASWKGKGNGRAATEFLRQTTVRGDNRPNGPRETVRGNARDLFRAPPKESSSGAGRARTTGGTNKPRAGKGHQPERQKTRGRSGTGGKMTRSNASTGQTMEDHLRGQENTELGVSSRGSRSVRTD